MNRKCRNCGHVKSLHWRPACNAVGCPCREFATRPAEDPVYDEVRDKWMEPRPAEDAEDRGTVNGEHRSAHE